VDPLHFSPDPIWGVRRIVRHLETRSRNWPSWRSHRVAPSISLRRRCLRIPDRRDGGHVTAAVENQKLTAGHSEDVGTNEPSDSELWERVTAHDGGAFGRLFDRHAQKVYSHCFRRTADWSLAEDLTSVVFLEAWRRRRDLRLSEGSILPWLLGVANNAIRNAERSRRRYRRLLQKLPRVTDLEAGETEMVARLDDEQRMKAALARLRELRTEEQEVLTLCDWSGLSLAEAGVALDIPVGTVKSRLARARTQLRSLAAEADSDLQVEVTPE
jgi:RNA polymerase sigma factor (sigma-70 family)